LFVPRRVGKYVYTVSAPLQPGEALTWETSLGNVHAVRDADTLYLYAHFRVLSDGPDQVVVP